MARNSFIVDLTDLRDIRAKLGEAERIAKKIDDRLVGVDDLQRESREWHANIEFLASKLPADVPGEPPAEVDFVAQTGAGIARAEATSNRDAEERPRDWVIEVINREVRKLRSIDVHAILVREGYDFTPDQVRNALHYAARRAKPPLIQSAPGRGMYAPLQYREVEPSNPHGYAPRPQAPETLRNGTVEVGRSDPRWVGGALTRR